MEDVILIEANEIKHTQRKKTEQNKAKSKAKVWNLNKSHLDKYGGTIQKSQLSGA